MQLFVTDYQKKNETVIINNPDLLSQIRKVLRAIIGDIIRIQDPKNELKKTRYEIRMDQWNDKGITWKILSEQLHALATQHIYMIVAMPNKWDKAELIVQKLSEIGIDKIIFWPSERSVIKERNDKKEERLQKIIKEAVEQSRGRKLPELQFTTDIATYIKNIENTEVIVFDKNEQEAPQGNLVKSTMNIMWIIWPEGGLTGKDYQQFEAYRPQIIGLWENVLRMETAAIIGARLLKNNE